MNERFIEDLKCFGSLEGMLNIKQINNTTFHFTKRHFYNFDTEVKLKIKRAESSRGAVSYTFTLEFTDVDNRDYKLKSTKFYTESALRDGIITMQRNIIA